MIRRPPRSTPLYSSAASDVYKRQVYGPKVSLDWTCGRRSSKEGFASSSGKTTRARSKYSTPVEALLFATSAELMVSALPGSTSKRPLKASMSTVSTLPFSLRTSSRRRSTLRLFGRKAQAHQPCSFRAMPARTATAAYLLPHYYDCVVCGQKESR